MRVIHDPRTVPKPVSWDKMWDAVKSGCSALASVATMFARQPRTARTSCRAQPIVGRFDTEYQRLEQQTARNDSAQGEVGSGGTDQGRASGTPPSVPRVRSYHERTPNNVAGSTPNNSASDSSFPQVSLCKLSGVKVCALFGVANSVLPVAATASRARYQEIVLSRVVMYRRRQRPVQLRLQSLPHPSIAK